MEPTPLERDILVWIALRATSEPLARQLAVARVTERLVTPSGFFTTLEPEALELIVDSNGPQDCSLDGPFITSSELDCGAISHLYICRGRVYELEVVALSCGHPDTIAHWDLSAVGV